MNLKLYYPTAYDMGETRHAQEIMKALGLSYKNAEAHSIGDCWFFFGVTGDVSNLPPYLTEISADMKPLAPHRKALKKG